MAEFCRVRISLEYDDVFLSETTYGIKTGTELAQKIAAWLPPSACVQVEKVYDTDTYWGEDRTPQAIQGNEQGKAKT